MIHYSLKKKKKLNSKIYTLIIFLIIFFIVAAVVDRIVYDSYLRPVDKTYKQVIFRVSSGETAKQVSDSLNSNKLIRSSWAMQLYMHGKNLTDKLQVGIYSLSPNQDTQQIVEILTSGKIQTNLITIIPGKTIFQIKNDLIKYGYTSSEVDYALNPSNYSSLPIFQFVPKGTKTLEGLLWPDSFDRNSDTPLTTIIKESLNETSKKLTSQVQSSFAKEGLSVYQGMILTSIINQEVSKYSDQTQVAQVFLGRLKNGISLGADSTSNYGAIAAGLSPSLTYDSPYNTRIHTGLTPTPISTLSDSSLKAAINPANTNWLYFVTGDDGTTYVSTTYAQHQANTAKYCHKLCGTP